MSGFDFDPETVYRRLLETGEKWSDIEATANQLEQNYRTLRARLEVEYIEEGCSKSASESYAMADNRMQLHVDGMCEARREALRCKVQYEAAKAWVEAMRTKCANLRMESRL